jgi:hypothetical protein
MTQGVRFKSRDAKAGIRKKLLLSLLTTLLISVCWIPTLPASAFSGPKLVLKEQEAHFKEVMEGKIVEHIFRVFNQGDEPLKILNVKPG